jgi:3-hydroxy acid dehydrogenase/malonic semialdehyde reductase
VSKEARVVALTGRTALVTGATSGFGRAIAVALHAEGATVLGTGRRADRLAALGAELGDRFEARAFDLMDDAATDAAIAGLAPDIVVHNAGMALGLLGADAADLSDWDAMIATNCRAVARLTRLLLPPMVASGRGHLVLLSSVAGSYPYPGGNVYGATKAFVTQFALNLRADLAGRGVRVTSIEPGMAQTEFSLVRFKGDEEKAAAPYRGMHPLSAHDVADAVLWAVTRPPHVNINRIELMPEAQAFGPFQVVRSPG